MGYANVVLATDLQRGSEVPWAHAIRLAAGGGKVKAVHAAKDAHHHPWSQMPSTETVCGRWGVDVVAVEHVGLSGDPAEVICQVMGADAPDLVVLGTHRPSGMQRMLQGGSVAEQVVRCREKGDTLIVPDGVEGLVEAESGAVSLDRILVPVSGEKDQQLAVDAAVRLAETLATGPVEFVLLHRPDEQAMPELVLPESDRWSWRREELPASSVVAAIMEGAVRWNVSAIVMVSHGHDSMEDALFGSMTERVLRDAFVPLMVVRP